MSSITKPTVHLNGSGRESLTEGYRAQGTAVQEAIAALEANFPHGRDYYPQGDATYAQARAEQVARIRALEKVCSEIIELWEHVESAGK